MSGLRKLLWPGLATLVALGILLSLGNWQLARRMEKTAQLAALEAALTETPRQLAPEDIGRLMVLAPGQASSSAGQISELSRVEIQGQFLTGRSVPVRATLPPTQGAAISGIGFFWMTPLALKNGAVVFINRGFVTSGGNWRPPAVVTPEGPQVITGLIRQSETARLFTPADDPAKGEFFSRTPSVMARAVGLDPATVAPFFIDAERTAGSLTPPVGVDPREMIARIPNNHLQYAVTWFAFAMTLVGVFGVFARARLKESKT